MPPYTPRHREGLLLGYPIEQAIVIVCLLVLIPLLLLWLRESRRQHSNKLVPKGYTKLGLPRHSLSNLYDEYDDKYSKGDSSDATAWKVKALYVFPIKSCAGVELDRAAFDAAGMLWDRKFAFAEMLSPAQKEGSDFEPLPKWTFRTLRQPGFEKLAKTRPEIWLRDGKTSPENQNGEVDGFMVVKFPYVPSGPLALLDRFLLWADVINHESTFKIPLVPRREHRYPAEKVVIWKDSPKWLNLGEHIPASFQTWLGARNPITLFRVDSQKYREVFRCAPRKDQVGYQPVVGFADAYPLHLLNLSSSRDIATRVKDSIPDFTVRRFRSNIVVTGPSKYDEDNWKRVKIGGHDLYCACHTIRCRLPNVDPDTAIRHPSEPDKTLRSFRCIDEGDPLNAALGLQLVPAKDKVDELKVGDEIRVLERGTHKYIKQ